MQIFHKLAFFQLIDFAVAPNLILIERSYPNLLLFSAGIPKKGKKQQIGRKRYFF